MKRLRETLARLKRHGRAPTSPLPSLLPSHAEGDSSSLSLDKTSSRPPTTKRTTSDFGSGSISNGPVILTDDAPDGSDGVDIVFVHDLHGHRVASWSKDGCCWPRLLANDIPHARVISWGYLDTLGHGNAMFTELAEALMSDLARLRTDTARPILFVAHGLGGILVKEALVTAAMTRIYGSHTDLGNIYPKTIGVVFLGTPHVRTGKRSLGECVASAAQSSLRAPNDQLLQALAENSNLFENQHGTFQMISRDIRIVCVREDLPTGQHMVPRDSAAYEGFNVVRDDLAVRHADLARFASQDEIGYKKILTHLVKMTEGPSQQELEAIETRNREILSMLYFENMHERQNRIPDAYEKTCEWIVKSEPSPFGDWLRSNEDDAIFWVSGKAGSGKSTLMKWIASSDVVRSELANSWAKDGDLMMVSVFLFEGGTQIQKSHLGILRSVLYQLLESRHDLIRIAFPSFFHGEWPPQTPFLTVTNLNQGVYSLFANLSDRMRLFIVVDGLDEYRIMDRKHHYSKEDLELTHDRDEGDQIWGQSKWATDSHAEIAKLITSMGNKDTLKVATSSRELSVFEEILGHCPRIRIQEHTEQAITRYLQARLEQEGLEDPVSLCKDLARRSGGDALWARLAVDLVLEGSLRSLRATLDALPRHLGGPDGLYMRMIEGMPRERWAACYRIFHLVLRSQQPPTLLTLAFADDGFNGSAAAQATRQPHTVEDIETVSSEMKDKLTVSCAGLLETEWHQAESTADERVVFGHQTAKEWASRKDIWQKLPGLQPIDEVELDLSLLSGCVRHLKSFGLLRPPVSVWPEVRFRPEAWLLVATALRYAARVDDKVPNQAAYVSLLDELNDANQQSWVSSLQNHKPLYEDPDWHDRKCPALCRKHWAGYEPMEAGKPPKRKDFFALAVQASLVTYVSVKLQALSEDMRRRKAAELLAYVVNPKESGISACAALFGDFVDLHHDMPDTRLLDVVFDAGVDIRASESGEANKVWVKTLKIGRRFFSRQHEVTHLLETSASHRLVQNRERWVAAVRTLLQRGADPHANVDMRSGVGEDASNKTYTAIELIRETLEGEPEYALDLMQMERAVRKDSDAGFLK